jgi:hypothetical protein
MKASNAPAAPLTDAEIKSTLAAYQDESIKRQI